MVIRACASMVSPHVVSSGAVRRRVPDRELHGSSMILLRILRPSSARRWVRSRGDALLLSPGVAARAIMRTPWIMRMGSLQRPSLRLRSKGRSPQALPGVAARPSGSPCAGARMRRCPGHSLPTMQFEVIGRWMPGLLPSASRRQPAGAIGAARSATAEEGPANSCIRARLPAPDTRPPPARRRSRAGWPRH